jgi:hypothetical protein
LRVEREDAHARNHGWGRCRITPLLPPIARRYSLGMYVRTLGGKRRFSWFMMMMQRFAIIA